MAKEEENINDYINIVNHYLYTDNEFKENYYELNLINYKAIQEAVKALSKNTEPMQKALEEYSKKTEPIRTALEGYSKKAESMQKALEEYSNKTVPIWKDINELSKKAEPLSLINKELQRSNLNKISEICYIATETIKNYYEPLRNNDKFYEAFSGTLSFQYMTIAKSITFFQTEAITNLKNNFINNRYYEGLYDFSKAFERKTIESPNIAFLKLNNILKDTISENITKTIISTISKMHMNTAIKLSTAKEITFDTGKSVFYSDDPSIFANTSETNILCSGIDLLTGITESEMLEFLNHISNFLPLAGEHPIGRKIKQIIRDWHPLINFDSDRYYHGRAFSKDECPYTEKQMCLAPHGITWHGRYNFPGDSHYYFSDLEKGAENEVRKHCRNEDRIQIAIIKPIRDISMVDLSIQKNPCKFLEYCRFMPTSGQDLKIKREYLIPSYVASCCKLNGFDGIKYYGSKEYSNYVCWTDGHFKTIKIDILN